MKTTAVRRLSIIFNVLNQNNILRRAVGEGQSLCDFKGGQKWQSEQLSMRCR